MNTKQTITAALLAAMIFGCQPIQKLHKTENTFANTHKESVPLNIIYNLHVISPTKTTKQSLSKGGVIISVEVVPFDVTRHMNQDRVITYADPTKPGYDIYEVSNSPY